MTGTTATTATTSTTSTTGLTATAARTSPVLVALDTADLDELQRMTTLVAPAVGGVKVGLEAFVAHGPAAVTAVQRTLPTGMPLFLDVKLHDIPNTVGRAAAVGADLGVAMLTVHAAGGAQMIAAAVHAAPDVAVLAVTVLTSLDDVALAEIGLPGADQTVSRLAEIALDAGARGVICASSDVARLRRQLGNEPLLVVPGIRPAEGTHDDQARVGTPAATMAAGADWLVVGRPITSAPDPAAAARRITQEAILGAGDLER